MKKHVLYSFLLMTAMAVALTGCKPGGKSFQVKGTLTSAEEGDTLYLEHRGLGGLELLDSTTVKKGGTFAFKSKAPVNPEFYQLRKGKQFAVFAVDSTETLTVKADAKDLFNTLSVENSPENDRIKQINQQYQATVLKINDLDKAHKAKTMDDVAYINELDSALNQYKTFASNLILGNPGGAAAYYAVFQKVNNYLIFDPYDRKDYSMFGAVATSWQNYYPDAPRAQHLFNFTMNALKTRRQQEQQAKMLENIPVTEGSALPDIVLPTVNGTQTALSSLKGKVVLLDFTVYNSEFSPKHNMNINTLYNRYKSRGFEVYQVSFDSDDHFWKNAAQNIPWIIVRDPQSVYSTLLSTYNVRNLPTSFVINRDGDVVSRVEDPARLEQELNKAF